MVVVYLKNGEKAPMPDANYVRLEAVEESRSVMLRCLFNSQEVGQFKWQEVAGYTISPSPYEGQHAPNAYEAWSRHLSTEG